MTAVALETSRLRPPLVAHLVARLELTEEDAGLVVDHLLRAEQAGKASHGLIRVAYATGSGKFGPYGGRPMSRPERTAPGRLHVDGRGQFGYALLPRLVEAGCDEAIREGVCVATGTPVYPSGALGDWARQAARRGVGIVMVANSPRRVAPPGGARPVVGTNAICIGLPARPLPFVTDCATSAIPHGALLVARASGAELPPGSAVGRDGQPTRSATEVDPTKGIGALLPFGASHKSFAIAMGIELLACVGGGIPGQVDAGRHGVFCTFLGPSLLEGRMAVLSEWLQALDRDGTRIPGWTSGRRALAQQERGVVEVSRKTLDALVQAGALAPSAGDAMRVEEARAERPAGPAEGGGTT